MPSHLSTSQGLALQHGELHNTQAQGTLMSAGGEWQTTSKTLALHWTVQGHLPGMLQSLALLLCPSALTSSPNLHLMDAAGFLLLWQDACASECLWDLDLITCPSVQTKIAYKYQDKGWMW